MPPDGHTGDKETAGTDLVAKNIKDVSFPRHITSESLANERG